MSDLISRQAAMAVADSSDYTGLSVEDVKKVTDEVVKGLKRLPSVDRLQGEWKHLEGDEWVCSNCGYVVWTEGSWEHPLEKGKNFCEHCGARM